MRNYARVCGLCLLSLAACSDEKSSLSPEALSERFEDKVWSYEVFEPYPSTEQPVQEVLGLWLGADGTYEQYLGFDPILTGTWKVGDGPALELVPVDSAPGTVTRYPIVKSEDGAITMRVPNGPPNELGLPTEVERVFQASDRCPPYLSRADGRYAQYFLGIHDPSTQFEGHQALDFDSQGDLHVIASRFQTQVEGFYLTTFGARCGLSRFTFAPQAGAVMEIDDNDVMHVAYGEGPAIFYASRPARAKPETPFEVTMVGTNQGASPKLSLAVAKDGSVAIVASRDDARYTVFRARDPLAASPVWEQADLPIQKEQGNQLVFGVSVAFDPSSRLYVAASPNGANVTVLRDDDGAFTELPIPPMPVTGAFFEGPDAFRVDDKGRWHLVAGSIGQPDSQVGPGKPGPLLYATGDEKGVTWKVVSAGGQASLDLGEDEAVHLYSFDRMLGGIHTTIRGDQVERYRATAREASLDRMAMGAGPKGRVGFGVSDGVQVLLPSTELPEHALPARVELENAQGARIVFPELGKDCADKCSFDVTDGRILQWTWDAPAGIGPMFAQSTACRGIELTGACWGTVSDDACERGLCPAFLRVAFDKADIAGFTNLVDATEQPSGWTVGTPAPSNDGFLVPLASDVRAPVSRVLRFQSTPAAPSVQSIDGFSGVRAAVSTQGGQTVVFGQANASAMLGNETGFTNEQIAAGVDAQGKISWVYRGKTSGTPPRWPVAMGDGVAFIGDGSVTRLGPEGQLVYDTPLTSLGERRGVMLLADGAEALVLGVLREEVAQSAFWLSRFTRLAADGSVAVEADLPGWVLSAARNAQGQIVMAVALRQGQMWDQSMVSADALALAIYDAKTLKPVKLGKPDTRHFAAADTLTSWPTAIATGSVLRDDGALLVAQEIRPRTVAIFELTLEETTWKVQLGGMGTYGASARSFAATGLVRAGKRIVLSGVASGPFDFGPVSATFEAPTPVLVELP